MFTLNRVVLEPCSGFLVGLLFLETKLLKIVFHSLKEMFLTHSAISSIALLGPLTSAAHGKVNYSM